MFRRLNNNELQIQLFKMKTCFKYFVEVVNKSVDLVMVKHVIVVDQVM